MIGEWLLIAPYVRAALWLVIAVLAVAAFVQRMQLRALRREQERRERLRSQWRAWVARAQGTPRPVNGRVIRRGKRGRPAP